MSAFLADFLSSVGKFQLPQGFKIYINKFSYSYISSLLLVYKQDQQISLNLVPGVPIFMTQSFEK